MSRIFDSVAGNHPSLNRFDLSFTNTFSMKMGILYVAGCWECYPGDVFKLNSFVHAELQPMVAPLMSDLEMYSHTFFVPYRLLYGFDAEDGKPIWEKFITGGEDGLYDTPLPKWNPSWTKTTWSSQTIWDSIGNPVSYTRSGSGTALDPYVYTWAPLVPHGVDVMIAPKYAYNFIWNNYYRDVNLQSEVAFTNEDLLPVAFRKDYFTSALEQQQRGIAPALPVDITLSGNPLVNFHTDDVDFSPYTPSYPKQIIGAGTSGLKFSNKNSYEGSVVADVSASSISASATTFNVSDMRLVFAMQRLMELNERSGYRYITYLKAHFGAYPTDERLDRPEYIGGNVMPVSISPLIQTSQTSSTPQGNKAGVGKIDSINKIGNYRVTEYGLIMTLVNIVPKPIYSQGINKQWLRQSRWDFYIPEMAYQSESAVRNCELYVDPTAQDTDGNYLDEGIFGYQAPWNELRCKQNIVTGSVREQFDYWTTARKFNAHPALNEDFIKVVDSDFNNIFAVQNEDEFIVSFSNLIDAYRPIPAYGVPGLVDHVYGGSYYG